LWIAVLGTQIVATLFAVYGFLMTPLGWEWALFVWAYALAWFLVNDRVKLLAYRIFDPIKAEAKPKAKAESQHQAKAVEPNAELKPDAKTESKLKTKAEPKPEAILESNPEAMAAPKPGAQAQTVADLSPQIAQRAYELFEEGGRQDGAAVKNWEKAESEIRKGLGKAKSTPETKAEPISVGKVGPQFEAKDSPQVVAKVDPQPEAKAMPKSEIKIEPKTEAHTVTPSEVPPQVVQRVHELYEKLGREDVRAVEDWERAKTREERSEK
jgi:H+-transporting ATPase